MTGVNDIVSSLLPVPSAVFGLFDGLYWGGCYCFFKLSLVQSVQSQGFSPAPATVGSDCIE